MKIPRYWAKVRATVDDPVPGMLAYGWSDLSRGDARALAGERLAKLSARFAKKPSDLPSDYPYPKNPLREEILQEFSAGDVTNVVTRNSAGALVLNTDRVVIVDADFPPDGFMDSVKRIFGRKVDSELAVGEKLRTAAVAMNCAMRLYRTKAGFRAIVTDRTCPPDDEFATRLFAASGADPRYVTLCQAQKSFRARLTPKPWRIGLPKPPSQFPRESPSEVDAFDNWLSVYVETMRKFSTCRFIEAVGSGRALSEVNDVLKVHDPLTAALETGRELA